MYHIYLDEEAVNAFALRLAGSQPFRDGTYTLYADVPVKCLRYEAPYFTSLTNLNTLDDRTAAQTVDFIITRGTEVMLCITTEVMASRSRKLFETVLHPIPHIGVTTGGDLRRKYRSLYHRVRDCLESLEENPYPCFSLTPFPVELSGEELKDNRLLNPNGTTNGYGRAQGLFFRYTAGAGGALERHPVSSNPAFRDHLKAVNRGTGDCNALCSLLETSMGELMRHHSGQWNELNDIMAALPTLQSYPDSGAETLLEEHLELAYRLRCRVGDGNPENQQIMQLTERLLICIAEVLSDERTAERFPVLAMPLRDYYEEAAVRSGLHYPQWLYDRAVRPFLNEARFGGTHTLQSLLLHRSYLPERTPCPDLMELLVLPLC